MKFPCLVSHAGLLSIALASHVHVPLEGDAKGVAQVANEVYEKPGYAIGVYHQSESVSFLQKASKNSNEHFKPTSEDLTLNYREIDIKDIDLSVYDTHAGMVDVNVFNSIADAIDEFKDNTQPQDDFETDNTPKVGDMVIVRHIEIPVKHTGELLFISEQYIIIRDSNTGNELTFHRSHWSIEKTPVEPTPHDLLKQAWFEQGQDVDDFIDYIVNEYGVVK